MTADIIDLKKRDLKKDPSRLAIDKDIKGGDTHSCEQERAEQRARYKAQNYNKWKYTRRRGHTEPDERHSKKQGINQTTCCGTRNGKYGIMPYWHKTGKNINEVTDT
eukprot:1127318-Heterocapsa_arctica.AAC.1